MFTMRIYDPIGSIFITKLSYFYVGFLKITLKSTEFLSSPSIRTLLKLTLFDPFSPNKDTTKPSFELSFCPFAVWKKASILKSN